ncbi:MAG: fumarylacetoacetate hydrolase family protein [Verrucomicrobiota bacterium]
MRVIRYLNSSGKALYADENPDGHLTPLIGSIEDGFTLSSGTVDFQKRLAPVSPTQIICIGLNYRRHAEETRSEVPDHPVVFMKSLNTVCASGDPILLPRHRRSKRVDYEIELAFVIGKKAKNIKREEALEFIAGYTIANDVSARDWQKWGGGGQWVGAKSFDSFCPIGPCLVTSEDIPNPQSLQLRTTINGEILQNSNTSDMIFSIAEVIEFLSGSTTLLPGTLVLTGTPEGVGMGREPMRFLQPGDQIEMTIEKIGSLINQVTEEPL